jgi:hypothetical protein
MRTSVSTRSRQATFTTEVIYALFFHILFDGMEFTLQGREALTKQGFHQQSDCKVGYATVATTCGEVIHEPHVIRHVTVIHDQCKEVIIDNNFHPCGIFPTTVCVAWYKNRVTFTHMNTESLTCVDDN